MSWNLDTDFERKVSVQGLSERVRNEKKPSSGKTSSKLHHRGLSRVSNMLHSIPCVKAGELSFYNPVPVSH